MQAVARGDAHARQQLARRLLPRVRRVAGAFFRQSADVEDATQSSFVQILHSSGGYAGLSSVEHWADRIVARTSMRMVSERKCMRARINDEVDPDALRGERREQGTVADLASLEVYLAGLPEAPREAILLRAIFGFSIQEISELTGDSENTIKSRLLRAREHVRERVRRLDHGTFPQPKVVQ
jgi:RNA polymerase sigma-70 factor (ECF subfamily)